VKSSSAQFSQNFSLLLTLVRRELKVKYRGSFLGYLWSMISPLLYMLIISLVFSSFMKGIDNYPLFVLSGFLFWILGSSSIAVATNSIVGGAGLIRKVKMPIWIFPVVPSLTFSTNFLLSLIPFFAMFLWSGASISPQLYLLPVVLVLYIVFIIGICLVVSSLNVFFRDIGHVMEPLLQITMYASPIIYDRAHGQIPPKISYLLGFNPFAAYIEAGRSVLFGGSPILLNDFFKLFCISALVLALGVFVYRYCRPRIIFSL
jgi:ABC-type polysaccharide/polyol phosphate export permease